MSTSAVAVLATVLSLASSPALAWEDHSLLTRPALAEYPPVARAEPVAAETLDAFLVAEQEGLARLLQEEEEWARANLAAYKPRPDALAFQAGDAATARDRFLRAIRVNPTFKAALYVKAADVNQTAGLPLMRWQDLTTLQDPGAMAEGYYVAVQPGEKVRVLDVVASASDEPDYGLDIGLFEDNGSAWGSSYGFGAQPFGNPKLEFGSQAPMHMGFYHEAGIVYKAASFLQECYPEARIHLYQSLARFAFEEGHAYWGWRFAGWGMHYVQDMAYPYHAQVLPGVGTGRMLWINALAMLGKPQAKDDAVQLVSNRHLVFETYVHDRMVSGSAAGLAQSLSWSGSDATYGRWHDGYIRSQVTVESTGRSRAVDSLLVRWMPTNLVSNPSFNFTGKEEGVDVVKDVAARGDLGIQALDGMAQVFLKSAGAYSRVFLASL